jgi:hypothetical protein
VGPRPQEDAIRRAGVANPNDFQFASADGLPDGHDLHQPARADGFEQAVKVRQAVGFNPRDVELRASHVNGEPHAIARETLGRQRGPIPSVLRDHDGLQLPGDGTRLSVPDVVQIPELERELRAAPRMKQEMNVPGCAIRR